MRVLFIHGIAQGGKNPAQLEKTWTETLQEGFRHAQKTWPTDIKVDFPYYGDKLDGLVMGEDLPPPEVMTKGPSQVSDFDSFTRATLDQIQKESISEAEVRAEMEPAASQEKGIQNWAWVRAIARVLDYRLTPVSDFTIEHFLREVFVYTSRKSATSAINAIIEAKLTSEPTVVVGHSLGTVVAYNVLRGAKGLDIRGLVTVGSPLGLKALAPKLGVLTNPVATNAWFNAFDPKDIVALRPLAMPHFGVNPAVVNHGEVVNNTSNRHGIVGYLNDRKVASRIAELLE